MDIALDRHVAATSGMQSRWGLPHLQDGTPPEAPFSHFSSGGRAHSPLWCYVSAPMPMKRPTASSPREYLSGVKLLDAVSHGHRNFGMNDAGMFLCGLGFMVPESYQTQDLTLFVYVSLWIRVYGF